MPTARGGSQTGRHCLTTSLELFATTAFIAVMSAVVASVLGYPVGMWLASLRRGRRLLTSVLLVPFILPAFLVGVSLRPLAGDLLDSSLFALVALIGAHALMNAGFLAVVAASSLAPRDQCEAAALDGASEARIRRDIHLPQQLPALSAAALLVALYSATSFGLVITLGQGSIRTLETEIVTEALQRLDLAAASVLAILQTLLTLGFFLLARRLGATPTALFGEGPPASHPSRLGAVLGLGLVVSILWILGGVIYRALTVGPGWWGNLANLAGRGARDLLNLSVIEATGNSVRNLVVATVISLALAWWLSHTRVGLAVLIPIGLSPVVLGLGALVISGYLPPGIAASWLLLPLVQVIFLTPLAFQILSPARKSLSSDLLDAARLDGANGLQRWFLIEAPVLRQPLVVAGSLVSLASLGEFGAARFLTYGSDQTLPLVMFRLMSRPGPENLGMAMTAATIFILLAVVVVWLISSTRQDRIGEELR